MALEDLNKGFAELFLAVLEHGIDSVRDSDGPMVPFAVVEPPSGQRQFQRFAGDKPEQCLAQAMEFAKNVDTMSRVVVVYNGSATVDGSQSEAIMAVGRERGAASTVLVAQRYSPKKFMKKFQTVGDPAIVGPGPSLS